MLRIHCIQNAAAAKSYYKSSDYFLDTPGTWLGEGAKMLGLAGTAKREAFEQLCDNINPLTGQSLTPKTVDGRRVGWDFNFNATKSVSIARELAVDPRIEQAHKEAVNYAMQHVEKDMATRVRVGGKDEDRITGNLIGMHVIHRTTRPNKEDGLPDMSLHSHVVVFNATFDAVEDKWKAGQIGEIKHDACFYEAIYQNRLAHNLKNLGYGIRRKEKSFEIEGVSDELIKKFSRRTATIEQAQKEIEEKYGTEMGPEAKAKLGATTRLHKVDISEDPLRDYWVSRLTAEEKLQLKGLIGKPSYQSSDPKAVQYAIGHMFERNSVVEERKLYETAIRHGIGSVTPEGIQAEAKRQGLLVKGKEATTKEVLSEEGRIIAFAREGRGTMRPLADRASIDALSANSTRPQHKDTATLSKEQQAENHFRDATKLVGLSPEQAAVCKHIWSSPDRVIMIEGDAGTGKTQTMQRTIPGIDKPGVFLAPSASASRGTLRKEGFSNADTIARFLVDESFREEARNGYIYIDEAAMACLDDIGKVFDHAKELDARVILQGDRKQNPSIKRGNLFEILDKYAGLPVGRLTETWRFKDKQQKAAMAAMAKGDILGGYDILDKAGAVKNLSWEEVKSAVTGDYMNCLDKGKSCLVMVPTHKEGDEVVAALRAELKNRGIVSKDEQIFERLRSVGWTEPQKGDRYQYSGDEIIQFTRSCGPYKAGQRVGARDVLGSGELPSTQFMAVYRSGSIALASGDNIRITGNGWTRPDGKGNKHRLDNGALYTVSGFTEPTRNDPGGDIKLSNGWIIDKGYGHIAHAYVATTRGGQGKTVDKTIAALAEGSIPAINTNQFYTDLSRARYLPTIYTSMAPAMLRESIERSDLRKSATELMGDHFVGINKKVSKRAKIISFAKEVAKRYRRLREVTLDAIGNKTHQYERADYER